MDNSELLATEARIRHKVHTLQRALAVLIKELETFADALAAHHGVDPALRSGGDADDKDPPPAP